MTFINLLPLMLSRGACVPAAVDLRDHVSFQTIAVVRPKPDRIGSVANDRSPFVLNQSCSETPSKSFFNSIDPKQS
jgi:hypothetical protein